jgi:carbon storage regulator
MLVLSRKPLQSVIIGSDIKVTVIRVERNQVRIGIEAPRGVSILRDELVDLSRNQSAADDAGMPGIEIVSV